jgi:hypothetical protein
LEHFHVCGNGLICLVIGVARVIQISKSPYAQVY